MAFRIARIAAAASILAIAGAGLLGGGIASAAEPSESTDVTVTSKTAPPTAGNTERPTGPSEGFCAVYLDKERDSKGMSKVASKQCSTISMEDAHVKAKAVLEAARPAGDAAKPLVDTLLANEYRDINYGVLLYSFYGTQGGCDAAGYTVTNFGSVAANTSSIRGYNACNKARVDDNFFPYQSEYFNLDVAWLGNLNDQVDVLHVYHG